MILVPIFAAGAMAAQPLSEPQSWITYLDYPESAIDAESEGRVRVELLIDSAGKPQGCSVSSSSGDPALDALTCTLLQQRARFSPARDATGQAESSRFVQQVRWAIPREQLISQGVRFTYSLDDSGRINDCRIDEFGNHDPDLVCSTQMIEELALTSLAKPLSAYSQVAILLAMQLDDDTSIAVIRPEGGERKILAAARINVSPDGVIAMCVPEVIAQYDGRSLDLCSGPVEVGQREFDDDPSGRERTLAVSFELIGIER